MNYNELKTNPDNPRIIKRDEFERLKGKISRNPDGLTANRIVYRDGIIIAGNQRFEAIKALGLEFKDDWFKDVSGWTDEQVREYLIISNISDGEWDWDILANGWGDDDLEGYGVKVPSDWGNINTEPPTIKDVNNSMMTIVVVAYDDINDLDAITRLYNLETIDMPQSVKDNLSNQRKMYVFKK